MIRWTKILLAYIKAGEDAIYVLTSSGIFSKYENGKFTRVRLGELKGCINTVLPDDQGGFWVSSCVGFFNISVGKNNPHSKLIFQ